MLYRKRGLPSLVGKRQTAAALKHTPATATGTGSQNEQAGGGGRLVLGVVRAGASQTPAKAPYGGRDGYWRDRTMGTPSSRRGWRRRGENTV